MADSLGIVGYDSFHFVVQDLERSRRFYAEALGFTEVARASAAKIEKGGEIASVFGAGTDPGPRLEPHAEGLAGRALPEDPPRRHLVPRAPRQGHQGRLGLPRRRAAPRSCRTSRTDEAEGGTFRTFNIATPLDDTTFRFIERDGKYPHFAPDFENVGDGKPRENPHGFATIDHVTSNAYTMLPVVNWYRDVLGFTHYWDVEFHTAEVRSPPHDGLRPPLDRHGGSRAAA